MKSTHRIEAACRDAVAIALIQRRFDAEKPAIDARMDANVERAVALRDTVKACKTDAQFVALLAR